MYKSPVEETFLVFLRTATKAKFTHVDRFDLRAAAAPFLGSPTYTERSKHVEKHQKQFFFLKKLHIAFTRKKPCATSPLLQRCESKLLTDASRIGHIHLAQSALISQKIWSAHSVNSTQAIAVHPASVSCACNHDDVSRTCDDRQIGEGVQEGNQKIRRTNGKTQQWHFHSVSTRCHELS